MLDILRGNASVCRYNSIDTDPEEREKNFTQRRGETHGCGKKGCGMDCETFHRFLTETILES